MDFKTSSRIGLVNFLALVLLALSAGADQAWSQTKTHLSIATGLKGGVYYPVGAGLAKLISRHLPDVDAKAVETTGSINNVQLLHSGKVALALTGPDTAWYAYQGHLKGINDKMAIRTLLALYSNYMHIVTLDGSGIKSVADLRGKRLSTGAPGSGTEVKGTRVMEAYGVTTKDLKSQARLGVSESARALKDRQIDAFLWDGGLPTSAVEKLAATPGIKIRLLPHGDAVEKMVAKYGPFYFVGNIPRGIYKSVDDDVLVAVVTNLLVAQENMDEKLAYEITRLFLEHTPELAAMHSAAAEVTLKSAAAGSPIPFHPGALRYFKGRGVDLPVLSR